MKLKSFVQALIEKFNKSETTILASSLAFYAALSLAPLLILFITISSQLSLSLQQTFYLQVNQVVGPEAARTIQTIIENAKQRPDLATLSGFFGVITLLLSASLIFGEMKFAFNKIYECEPRPPITGSFFHKAWIMGRTKLAQIGLALGCIFIMIVSLLASSVISAAVPVDQPFWRIFNLIISFVFYIGLFALIFHAMPDDRIAWKDTLRGGVITAFLFLVGKELIALYLGHSAIGSPYGVAGSLILLLVWIYYTAMITFVGAHISSLIASNSHAPSPDHGRSPVKGEPLPAR